MSEEIKLTPYAEKDLVWNDITGLEEWRVYDYGDGRTYRIERPVMVNVQRSAAGDSHRLIDEAGIRHYVGKNWVAFSFGGEWGLGGDVPAVTATEPGLVVVPTIFNDPPLLMGTPEAGGGIAPV